ncbi:hypothetical protein A1E_04590 [Rickettsia canadensis str. McKiel]|uniref:Uncharacterized protein n=1 Tax=Rickettsia canadensis (strain McKiel) TaxID=293613 RepID=A8EZR0_RICCK|nr:hypothetical protein A1E_04590 [Rickettsia canadensis str. McKiel]
MAYNIAQENIPYALIIEDDVILAKNKINDLQYI